jgi:hypothetical protein
MSQQNKDDAFMILNKIKDTAGLKLHEVAGMDRAITILKSEVDTCKYNCRTKKDVFLDGYAAGYLDAGAEENHIASYLGPDEAYKEWKNDT